MKKIDFKSIKKEKLETILVVILLILLAIVIGKRSTITSDFNPTNGDFQTYNII